MNPIVYTVVRVEDWVGIYNEDGNLLGQGHSFDPQEVIKMLGYDVETIWLENMPTEEGSLPNYLDDVPEEWK